MRNCLLGMSFLFSASVFANDTLCYTRKEMRGLLTDPDISGLTFKSLGEGKYSVIESAWMRWSNAIRNSDIGTFSCTFQSETPDFTKLFVCGQPRDKHARVGNVIFSKIVERPYIDLETGKLQTVKELQMEMWLRETAHTSEVGHPKWDTARCTDKQTFEDVVERERILR